MAKNKINLLFDATIIMNAYETKKINLEELNEINKKIIEKSIIK